MCLRRHIQSFLTVLLVICSCARVVVAVPPKPWHSNAALAVIGVATNGEPIRVPVRLDGARLTFLVDTGCSRTILAKAHAKETEKRAEIARIVTDTGSVIEATTQPVARFQIEAVDCPWITNVLVNDIEHISHGLGVKLDGVLGMDVLSRFLVHIDLDNGFLALCDSANSDRPPGTRAPLIVNDSVGPGVVGRLDERDCSILIDTGLIGGCHVSFQEYMRLAMKAGTVSTGIEVKWFNSAGVPTTVSQLRCKSMEVGGVRTQEVVCEPARMNAIGIHFLARYRLTLDFPKKQSYWLASNRAALSDRRDYCGLVTELLADGSRSVVAVAKDSIASKSGFRVGDRIVSLDNTPLEEVPAPGWNRALTFLTSSEMRFNCVRMGEDIILTIKGG